MKTSTRLGQSQLEPSPSQVERDCPGLLGGELPPQEKDVLRQCEEQIEAGLHSFIVVGNALCMIKDQRLYRAQFSSFEEYCQSKWGIGRQYAYRLIAAGQVVRRLSPNSDAIPLPANESQVRPLINLDELHAFRAWNRAVQNAGSCPVTAGDVKAAIQELGMGVPKRKNLDAGKPDLNSDVYLDSAWALVRQMEKALRKRDLEMVLGLVERLRIVVERIQGDQLKAPAA
jgi:hypothetical protein